MTHHATPIACTIPLTEVDTRNLDLADLLAQARTTERIDGGVVMAFDLDLRAVVEDLVAKEAQCCGFLSMVIDTHDNELRLTVTADDRTHLRVLDEYLGLDVRHDG